MSARFKSLTWKQTTLVVFSALFFAVAIFIVEVALVGVSARQQLMVAQEELLDSIEQPAANAVWALDDNLATQTLEGVLKVEHVGEAVIELDDGSMFVSMNNPFTDNPLVRKLSEKLFGDLKQISRTLYRPSFFEGTEKQQIIGTLTIFYNTQELTDSLFSQLRFSFLATLARALLVTMALSIIFHRFLTDRKSVV